MINLAEPIKDKEFELIPAEISDLPYIFSLIKKQERIKQPVEEVNRLIRDNNLALWVGKKQGSLSGFVFIFQLKHMVFFEAYREPEDKMLKLSVKVGKAVLGWLDKKGIDKIYTMAFCDDRPVKILVAKLGFKKEKEIEYDSHKLNLYVRGSLLCQ